TNPPTAIVKRTMTSPCPAPAGLIVTILPCHSSCLRPSLESRAISSSSVQILDVGALFIANQIKSCSPAPDARDIARVLLKSRRDGVVAAEARFVGFFYRHEDPSVILGHHLHEFGHHVLPELEDVSAPAAAGVAHVT